MADWQSLSDEELAERAKTAPATDLRAVEHLIRRHQRRVLANCRYMTQASAEAEDLAQEVFVKAYFGLRRFEGRSRFRTWLQRIKVNHCLNFLKKQEGKSFVGLDEPEVQADPEMHVAAQAERAFEARSRRERIADALGSLSDTLRVPLILRDLDGLSYQEIADILGLGLSAVKMRIKRAREEFRSRFAGRAGEPPPEPDAGAGGRPAAAADGVDS